MDSNGRLCLSAKLRRKYGEKFHVVEYEDRLELVPIDEDPIQALREAAGGAFDGKSVDELRDGARARAKADARTRAERRERPAGDDTE